MIHLPPFQLLRAEIVKRTHDRTLARARALCFVQLETGGRTDHTKFRQAEVEELRPILGEKDVRRFEISVDDSTRVGSRYRIGQGYGDRQHMFQLQRASVESFVK